MADWGAVSEQAGAAGTASDRNTGALTPDLVLAMRPFVSAQVRAVVGTLPDPATWDEEADRALAAACKRIDIEFEAAVTRAGEQFGSELSRAEYGRLYTQVLSDVLRYDPIQTLLDDPAVSEVMINGPRQVWAERAGRLELTPLRFHSSRHLAALISRILTPLGKGATRDHPLVDARLPDGSRVNIVVPPAAVAGSYVSIRKFGRTPLTPADLVRNGTFSQRACDFLRASVRAGLNIIVSGGTSTGKTTLLNALSSVLPEGERIVTIEDAAELQLQQVHVVPMEARPPKSGGSEELTIRDLVINALRMRPDRIVVGECRGSEALDMLQAMNTGHDGCMTTLHANSPRDALTRLETMVLLSGLDLPTRAIRTQIAASFHLIIHMTRSAQGPRLVTSIYEIQGLDDMSILMQEIFSRPEPIDSPENRLQTVGLRPRSSDKLVAAGEGLPGDFFKPEA